MSNTDITASIITIGDELLIGQTIDTNSAWLGTQLNAHGIWMKERIAVGDVKHDIVSALQRCECNSNIVIITGGLGPTADDITKPLLCEYFQSTMVCDEKVLEHVTQFFAKRNRPMLAVNTAQAMVPAACEVLWNTYGTAPGMWFQKEGKIIISLPGVPGEMKAIFTEHALPKLLKHFATAQVIHKCVSTAGVGESFLAARLNGFEKKLSSNIKLAYLPQLGGVKLRLTTTKASELQMQQLHTQLFELCLPEAYACEDISLQSFLVKTLTQKNMKIGFAESCTGGAICAAMTSVKGSSNCVAGSLVTYMSHTKATQHGIPTHLLENNNAVSEEVATLMAKNTLGKFGCDIALSITGFLEHENEQLHGKIFIGVASRSNVEIFAAQLPYDRQRNCELAVQLALKHLWGFLEK